MSTAEAVERSRIAAASQRKGGRAFSLTRIGRESKHIRAGEPA